MKLIGYLKKKKRNIEYRAMQKLTHKYIPKDIRLSANSCDVVQLCTAREYLVCKDPSLWATTLKKRSRYSSAGACGRTETIYQV